MTEIGSNHLTQESVKPPVIDGVELEAFAQRGVLGSDTLAAEAGAGQVFADLGLDYGSFHALLCARFPDNVVRYRTVAEVSQLADDPTWGSYAQHVVAAALDRLSGRRIPAAAVTIRSGGYRTPAQEAADQAEIDADLLQHFDTDYRRADAPFVREDGIAVHYYW